MIHPVSYLEAISHYGIFPHIQAAHTRFIIYRLGSYGVMTRAV